MKLFLLKYSFIDIFYDSLCLKTEFYQLLEKINKLPNDEMKAVKLEELKKMSRQIGYYDSLTKDMKKAVRPPTLSELLASLTISRY